jgi:hypothetical protein
MARTWDDLHRGQPRRKTATPQARTLSQALYDHNMPPPYDEASTFLDEFLRPASSPVRRGQHHKKPNHGFGENLTEMYLPFKRDEEPEPCEIVDMTRATVHGDRCTCDRCGNVARPPAAVIMSPEAPGPQTVPEPARLPGGRQTLAELGISQDEADGRDFGLDSWSEERQIESILPRNATLSVGDIAALLHTTPKYVKQLIQEGVLPPAPYRTAGKHRRWTQRQLDALQDLVNNLGLLESRRMSKFQRERLRKLSHVAFDQIAAELK